MPHPEAMPSRSFPKFAHVHASSLSRGASHPARALLPSTLPTNQVTLGITGWSVLRVHIRVLFRHLDVGSELPDSGLSIEGWAVRPLMLYVSWVNNVARQLVPYLTVRAGAIILLREDCLAFRVRYTWNSPLLITICYGRIIDPDFNVRPFLLPSLRYVPGYCRFIGAQSDF